MNRQRPLGTHHSHYQPRRADGAFVSYEQAGRRLGQHAVLRGQRVVVTSRSVRFPCTVRPV